jgi:hypothetical protein
VEISEEERERRRASGLCLRCGKEGHYGRNCPDNRPAGRAVFTITEDGEDFVETYEVDDCEDSGCIEGVDEHEEENGDAIQELPGDS